VPEHVAPRLVVHLGLEFVLVLGLLPQSAITMPRKAATLRRQRKALRDNAEENVMKRRILTSGLTTSALLLGCTLAVAQQSGTAAEARAMLDHSVAALKANATTALAAFNDKGNKDYHDRDLYVFCYSMTDGKFAAHPNPAMMGTDVRTLKIGDDALGQRIFDTIKSSPEGTVSTVDYNFPKPGTTEAVPKQSFVVRIADEGCGVGYYK
jgi:cytochrome c